MERMLVQVLTTSLFITMLWGAWKLIERLFRAKLRKGFLYGILVLLAIRLIAAVVPLASNIQGLVKINGVAQSEQALTEQAINDSGEYTSDTVENIKRVTGEDGGSDTTSREVKTDDVKKAESEIIKTDKENWTENSKLKKKAGEITAVIERRLTYYWGRYNMYWIGIWMAGCIFMTILYIVRYSWVKYRLKQDSYQITARNITRILEECGLEIFQQETKKLPDLKFVKNSKTPFVMGIRKPVLYLPQILLKELSDIDLDSRQELRYMMIHELIHIKHRDLWGKALFCLATVIHWFNPVVWKLQKDANQQMELWCDETVVRHMSTEERLCYSRLLLKTLEKTGQENCFLSTQFSGGAKRVKQRLFNIMDMDQKRYPLLSISFISVLMAVSIFGVSYQEVMSVDSAGIRNLIQSGMELRKINTTIESMDGVKEDYTWNVMPSGTTVQEPPKVSISLYGQELGYGIVLNDWDKKTEELVEQSPDFFAQQVKKGEEIPSFFTKTVSDQEFQMVFDGEAPQAAEVTDVVLDENGNHLYAGQMYEVIHRLPGINQNTLTFNLGEHATIWFYEDWTNANDLRMPFYRGYEIKCYWVSEERTQIATYLVVIRTIPLKYSGETLEEVKTLNGYSNDAEAEVY